MYYEKRKDLSNFMDSLAKLLNHDMLIFFLDYGLLKYIEKLSEKTGISAGEVLAQVKPHKKTILMQYQDELKNLDKKDIKKFVKKWEWVGTHLFMGQPLDEEKVNKELADVSKKHEDQTIQELPAEYKSVLDIGSKLAFYRSYIIEIADGLMYQYWPILKELSKNNNLSWDEILLLTYKEIISLNDNGTLPENFKERKKGYGIVFENKKMFAVAGRELERRVNICQRNVDKNITEIRGMVASKGKIIRGVAKVVESSKHISKMKKGDILVANETTPDYVVGMRIAGAIITDMGGITSHAAITSRELGIPCIIGTKIATKVLKDGDLLAVDAELGIVKILKRK